MVWPAPLPVQGHQDRLPGPGEGKTGHCINSDSGNEGKDLARAWLPFGELFPERPDLHQYKRKGGAQDKAADETCEPSDIRKFYDLAFGRASTTVQGNSALTCRTSNSGARNLRNDRADQC